MEISFANRKLKKECESQSALQSAHGQACARKVMTRIADLQAAASLADLRELPGRCEELKGDRRGQLSLTLPDGKRLVFESAANPSPRKTHGGLDWSAVKAIRLLEIENYHRG